LSAAGRAWGPDDLGERVREQAPCSIRHSHLNRPARLDPHGSEVRGPLVLLTTATSSKPETRAGGSKTAPDPLQQIAVIGSANALKSPINGVPFGSRSGVPFQSRLTPVPTGTVCLGDWRSAPCTMEAAYAPAPDGRSPARLAGCFDLAEQRGAFWKEYSRFMRLVPSFLRRRALLQVHV
jgi:hypothetical protein